MKKILSLSAIAVALLGLVFTGCASGSKASDEGPKIPHPRSYVLDPADKGAELAMPFNSYGPNYQGTVDMWSWLKKDKPQAGDTVQIRGRLTSDTDIPNVVVYLTDTSPAANYWTNLCGDNYLFDVKAGVPVDINFDVVLDTSTKGGLVITFAYDGSDHGQEGFDKVGKAAKFTFEKVADTTDTAAESGVVAPTGPVSTEVDLGKYAAFLQIETNHPWVNGVQDMSVIANYQAVPEVTAAFGDFLPKDGDKIIVKWRATADVDIAQIKVRAVDNSSAAGWWKELESTSEGTVMVKDVKAGEPFEAYAELNISADAVAQVALCIWYDIGEANPDGPAICKIAK